MSMTRSPLTRLSTLQERAEQLLAEASPPGTPHLNDEVAKLSEDLRIYATELEIQTQELMQTQQRAELASQRYQQLFDHMPMPALVVDKNGAIRQDNLQARAWLGEPNAYSTNPDRRFMHHVTAEHVPRITRQLMQSSAPPLDNDTPVVVRDVCLNGAHLTQHHVDLHILPLPLSYHADGLLLLLIHDRTAEQQAQQAQRLSEAVFMNAKEAIIVTEPDTRILRVNPAFERISGFSASTVLGQKASFLRSGRQSMGFYQAMWATIHTAGYWEGEFTNRNAMGGYYTVWSSITALQNPAGEVIGYMGVQTDLTALRLAESEVNRLSSYDGLTGLPNRELLMDRLACLQAYAHRQNEVFSVLFADVDHFKDINDNFGHHTGDLLLQTVAQRLREQVREQDTVARLGGDEFVLVLPNTSKDAALGVAHKLRKHLHQPLGLDGLQEYQPELSIGVAEYPTDGDSTELLLRHADTAMYAAKLGGRNRATSYTPTMSEASARVFALQSDLAKCVQRGELRMVLQPQFDLGNRRIVGAEALVRWHRPLHGLVSPAEFIPVAEKTGMIAMIDDWMLAQAIQHMAHWQRSQQWPDGFSLSLNQTASDLRGRSWLSQLQELLRQHPITPGSLHIELTESDLLQPTADMIGQLHTLNELGVTLAIDDFGTGYSSLAYLKSLPVSIIKIDQSFVRDMTSDANARILVEAMIDLAHKLGHTLVAEGVETEAQCAALHQLGCEAGQGYLVNPPLSVADFERRYLPLPGSSGGFAASGGG